MHRPLLTIHISFRDASQEHISDLKFAYLESNAKLEFVNHILNPEGYQPVVKEAIDELGMSSRAPSSR
jgi:uncharacterized membrane protein YcaP (DUF421 family)